MDPAKTAAVGSPSPEDTTFSTPTQPQTTPATTLGKRTSSNPLSLPSAIPPRTSSNAGVRASLIHGAQQPSPQPPSSNLASIAVSPVPVPMPGTEDRTASPPLHPAAALRVSPPPPPAKQSSAMMEHQLSPTVAADPARYAIEDLHFTPQRSWTDDKERIVRGPFDYVISHPGKDIRSQLIAAFNAWLDVPPASLAVITRVVGMLHESSLLVDDVQDGSELRRGFPVAHAIFGVAQTINSANYIYFAALRELLTLDNQQVLATFAEELVNLHRGQGMDLFWRDTLTCPSEDDYLEMVGNKTGGLFRLGIKLMQAESRVTPPLDCVPLVNLIGLIFQIRDDYVNLKSSDYSQHKGICEDLTEGKFSFPVIHSIRSNPSDLQLVNILKQKTTDVQVKRYAVTYMESTGSFEYTHKVLTTLIERARKLTLELDDGRGKQDGILAILDKMVLDEP